MEKYSLNDIIKKVSEIENNEYKLLSKEYTGINQKVLLEHKCGYQYECKLKGFLNEGKSRCPKCKKRIVKSTKLITIEELNKRINDQVGNEYSYIEGYKNMNTKCLFKHNTCGHEWLVQPNLFLGTKQSRCPICSNENRGKYAIKENYLQLLLDNSIRGNQYIWLEEYKNNNKLKHKIKHLKCNKEFLIRPNDFQQGYGCPYCNLSRGEERIISYLDKLNIDYSIGFKFNDCKNKALLPFDVCIFCGNPNEYILIEYDGPQHEKETFLSKDFDSYKLRDEIKNKYYESHDNIDLYRINYKDYNNIEKIIDEILSKYN